MIELLLQLQSNLDAIAYTAISLVAQELNYAVTT
jgi:hypothetical protein